MPRYTCLNWKVNKLISLNLPTGQTWYLLDKDHAARQCLVADQLPPGEVDHIILGKEVAASHDVGPWHLDSVVHHFGYGTVDNPRMPQ